MEEIIFDLAPLVETFGLGVSMGAALSLLAGLTGWAVSKVLYLIKYVAR